MDASPISVLVADDFPVMRDALGCAFGSDPRFELADVCVSGAHALSTLERMRVDVVLLDAHLPDCGGPLLTSLRTTGRLGKLLVLVAPESPIHGVRAMTGGADGCLSKRQPLTEMTRAVLAIHAGGTVLDPDIALLLADLPARGGAKAPAGLTADEIDVLCRVAAGQTDGEIARGLFVSPRTVQNVLGRIRAKTGQQRRPELTRWAMEHDLL